MLSYFSLSTHKLNNKTYSSPTPNTPKKKSAVYKFPYQQSQDDQADSKKKKRHQSSYVDETLFGEEHPVVADFPAPWESQHYKHDQVKGRYHRTALPHTTANRHVSRTEISRKRYSKTYLPGVISPFYINYY